MGKAQKAHGQTVEAVIPDMLQSNDGLTLRRHALRSHFNTIKSAGAAAALAGAAIAAPNGTLQTLAISTSFVAAAAALVIRQRTEKSNNHVEFISVDQASGQLVIEINKNKGDASYDKRYDLDGDVPGHRERENYGADYAKAYDKNLPLHAITPDKDKCFHDGEKFRLPLGRLKFQAQKDSLDITYRYPSKRGESHSETIKLGYGFSLSARQIKDLKDVLTSVDRYYANGTDSCQVVNFNDLSGGKKAARQTSTIVTLDKSNVVSFPHE